MRTAVLLAPYFAPSSMPPALRMGLFARHLPEFGWHPIVLTTEAGFLEGPMDPVNQRLLPEGMEIIRTRALQPAITRRIGFSDLGIRGLPYLWSALASLCQRQRPDAVFISVPPNPTRTLGSLKTIGVCRRVKDLPNGPWPTLFPASWNPLPSNTFPISPACREAL